MDLREFLRAVRRRWSDVALAVMVSLIAGWAITGVAPAGPVIHEYQATSVILSTGYVNGGSGGTAVANMKTLASLTTITGVAERVAKDIHFGGSPQSLASDIEAVGDQESGLLKITATSSTADRATALADGFSRELLAFLSGTQTQTLAGNVDALKQRLDRMQKSIESLDSKISSAGGSEREVLTAQRDANVRQYSVLYEQYQQLASASALVADGLQIIQKASPVLVSQGGIQAPHTRAGRLLLAGFLGLLAGLGLILFLERFDTKIRTKEGAEQAFDLPVLAEIPSVPVRRREDLMVVTAQKSGTRPANAFRVLGSALSHYTMEQEDAVSGNGHGNGDIRGRTPQVIMVTSAGPSEGKTTITANLAATFAAVGRRVVVVSCDFRRPRLHKLFNVPAGPGLVEELASSNGRPILEDRIFTTSMPNVAVIPSGAASDRPSELLASEHMRRVLQELRALADITILDTAPILTVSDATYLLTEVDAVLVVARAGRTTTELAQRTSELLRRSDAPVAGVVLNAAKDIPVPRGYYGYHRYGKGYYTSKTRKGFSHLFRHRTKV